MCTFMICRYTRRSSESALQGETVSLEWESFSVLNEVVELDEVILQISEALID